MEKFTQLTGLVVPLDRSNVDTDAIIPKQFLKSIYRTGYGPNAFDEWRYLDKGEPGMDNTKRPLNPDFVLNFPRYQGAEILLARTRALGSAAKRFPLRHRGEFCGHLLFEFFEKRIAAHRAPSRRHGSALCRLRSNRGL